MNNAELHDRFASLTTAHVADACIRTDVNIRCGPPGMLAVTHGHRASGRVLPTRHAGSVDIFLEAFEQADTGDVLVVDNAGRRDEACVGDLVVLEAQQAGLAGMVVWGLHRDTADITAIGLPVFSLGASPTGPRRLDPRPDDAVTSARMGVWTLGRDDVALADEDGVLFVPAERLEHVLDAAETIRDTERRQAERMRGGVSLRNQVRLDVYLQRRADEPSYTFRDHLRDMDGAVEV